MNKTTSKRHNNRKTTIVISFGIKAGFNEPELVEGTTNSEPAEAEAIKTRHGKHNIQNNYCYTSAVKSHRKN